MVHEGCNPLNDVRGGTHIRIEVIDARDRVLHVAALQRLAYVHPVLDAVKVHRSGETGFLAELHRRGLVTLNDEVVHDEAV